MKHLIKLLQNYFQMVFTLLDQVITQKIGPLKSINAHDEDEVVFVRCKHSRYSLISSHVASCPFSLRKIWTIFHYNNTRCFPTWDKHK